MSTKNLSKLLLHHVISWTSKGNNRYDTCLQHPLWQDWEYVRVAKTRLIYVHTFWAKDCKYSIQNMLALITDSAVLHMNSELERRGNVSNWLPIHSWPHWLGSRTKTPHRGRKQELEKDGEGGAPADTCGPIKTSSNDGEGWPRRSTPLCTQTPERMHLHAHGALWRQHFTIVNVHKKHMRTKAQNLLIVTND